MARIIGRMPDGAGIAVVDLRGGGLSARVLTLGAIVQDLRLDGVPFPLVLGSPDPLAYLGPMVHVGALVGRYANRIGGAGFVLDGVAYRTDANWRGRHTLHGGAVGSGQQLWQVVAQAPDRVVLALRLPDGDMGFPGTLAVQVAIRLGPGAVLGFDIRAQADRATPCSFTHHGYFRLDDGPDLGAHRLRIAADRVLDVDGDLIPTGRLVPVAGGPDFRRARSLAGWALDHGFALPPHGRRPRPVAMLDSAATGLAMRVETSAPGLQVHTATGFPAEGLAGHAGHRHGPGAGIALEAQEWPDAPNHPRFPPAILRPGGVWRQTTRYRFTPPEGPP